MTFLKFIQANLDHTRAATSHLVDFIEAEHIDVAIVSDPCARGSTVPGVPPNWLCFLNSATPRCMVLIPKRRFDVFPLAVSPYIVALRLQHQEFTLLLIAVYAAPSVPLDFTLSGIEDVLQRHRVPNLLLAGDFNARNPLWGGTVLNSRGIQLAHFIHGAHLRILNDPMSIATFHNAYSESWIDLTLVSGTIWDGNPSWEVRDTSTLSDHKYVVFGPRMVQLPQTKRLSKAALQHLVEELASDDWIGGFTHQDIATPSALNSSLDRFYSKLDCLKRKFERLPKQHKGNMWWSDAIARERSAVRVLRRRYQQCRDPFLRADYKFIYYWRLAAYRENIQLAKDKAVRQACSRASGKNLFGQPFNVAFNQLRAPSVLPSLHVTDDTSTTSTIQSADLLMRTHFPVDERDDTLAHMAIRTIVASTPYPAEEQDDAFTLEELQLASRNLNANAAPGLDGVTTPMVRLFVHHIPNVLLCLFNCCLANGHFPPTGNKHVSLFC